LRGGYVGELSLRGSGKKLKRALKGETFDPQKKRRTPRLSEHGVSSESIGSVEKEEEQNLFYKEIEKGLEGGKAGEKDPPAQRRVTRRECIYRIRTRLREEKPNGRREKKRKEAYLHSKSGREKFLKGKKARELLLKKDRLNWGG